MEGVMSYRLGIGKKLVQAVEDLSFENTNQFVDSAVTSALVPKDSLRVQKLVSELAVVIYNSAPLRFSKPAAKEDKEIGACYAEMKTGRLAAARPMK